MADSTGHTGQQIIGEMNKDILRELYIQEDIVTDYKILRSMMADPDISKKDFAVLLKLLWEFTIEKPKTTSEVIDKGLSKFTDEQLEAIIEKHKLDDNKVTSELGENQETTQNG